MYCLDSDLTCSSTFARRVSVAPLVLVLVCQSVYGFEVLWLLLIGVFWHRKRTISIDNSVRASVCVILSMLYEGWLLLLCG